jgi:AraC-like DNA-binding protein
MTKIAKVIDIAPAHLRRALRSSSAEQAAATIIDDIADGIEAIHQLSNLAGFSERPRAFIFALASAAHKAGDSFVELYDDELAAQQGCSTRTVRRQRADYLKESRAKRFGFVEVIEGDYNQGTNQNAPTRYRFHVGGQIAEAVELARQTEDWAELSRAQQRKAIARACEDVFQTIPDARRQKRKGRRPRLATSEIETCMKVIETTWAKMHERLEHLSADDHGQLMEDPGELRERLLTMSARLDNYLENSAAESVDAPELDRGVRTICPNPPVSAPSAASGEPVRVSDIKNTRTLSPPALEPIEHTPEAISLFENICDRLTAPTVQTAEIELKAPPQAEDIDLDTLAERAAILEYDGAVERAEAEARAGEVLRE